MQNPKERITLGKMMKHPWVTRRGSWPLRTMKEMVRVGETPELPPVLPDLMSTLNVLDIPRQVHHMLCGTIHRAHSCLQGQVSACTDLIAGGRVMCCHALT